jgi:hypothetical protein
LPGQVDQRVELTPEPDLLAEHGHAPLEGEGRRGDPPAVADLADDEITLGTGAVEEDLVELGRAGELPDRPDRDTGLAHRNQQIGQAGGPPRTGLCPGQHEAPVGHVGQGCPHLLAGHHPLVAVEGGRGGDGRQVRSGARLGVTLAPEFGRRGDRRQEPPSLLRGAQRDQGRPE